MFQKNLLAGKRILVTGGATGLGKSMGKRFLELGASLYICGRREEVLKEAATELSSATGGTVKTFACDVRENARVEAMIEEFWKDGPLDVLVNNAAGNFIARTEDLSTGAYEAVIGIVLMGTIHCTMACGKRWLKAGHKANVLNISTTYAELGSGYVVPSAVAKAGVLAMTRSLAVEAKGKKPWQLSFVPQGDQMLDVTLEDLPPSAAPSATNPALPAHGSRKPARRTSKHGHGVLRVPDF